VLCSCGPTGQKRKQPHTTQQPTPPTPPLGVSSAVRLYPDRLLFLPSPSPHGGTYGFWRVASTRPGLAPWYSFPPLFREDCDKGKQIIRPSPTSTLFALPLLELCFRVKAVPLVFLPRGVRFFFEKGLALAGPLSSLTSESH